MLTKRKALEKTIEMWSWLAENPNKHKRAYFNFKGIDENEQPAFLCYCCEYTRGGSCVLCPIKNWNIKQDNVPCECVSENSVFQLWAHSHNFEKRKNYALKIVALAKKALDTLESNDFVRREGYTYSLDELNRIYLPHLSSTKDYSFLLENLSFDELKKIEHILEAYPDKIDMKIPRYEDSTPQFDGEFKLIVKDDSYEENGFEILVLKWIEDYEDTGYLVDCLKED